MGIVEMDFEMILGVPFFIVILSPSFCVNGTGILKEIDGEILK